MVLPPMVVAQLLLLLLIMAGLGAALSKERLLLAFRRPLGLGVAMLLQFFLMPPLAFGVARALGLESGYAIGLIVMCCCPGGAFSNLVCFIVQADITLSVAMTATSSLLACAMMPLNLWLYLQSTGIASHVGINVGGIAMSAAAVCIGTSLGVAASARGGRRLIKTVYRMAALAALGLIIIAVMSNAKSETPVWTTPGQAVEACALPPLIGAVVGCIAARMIGLPWPSAIAMSIEVSLQNKGVAIAVIGVTLGGAANAHARNAALAMPFFYALFSALGNLLWGIVAWKLGLTYLDRHATCATLPDRLREARLAQKDPATPAKGAALCRVGLGACDAQATLPSVSLEQPAESTAPPTRPLALVSDSSCAAHAI